MQTKCAAFWNHINIRNDNRVFPCCRFKTPIAAFNGNVNEILFYKEYDILREKASKNEYIEGCAKCYHEEEIGKTSLREKFNTEYSTENISLKFLEIGFDNICNLTCDGCWEDFSSSWAKKLNFSKDLIVKTTTEIEHIPESVDKVLFLGGEPLMTSRHKKFLKKISKLQDLTVMYNTNGTFLLDEETIQLLSACKDVEFIVSVDGYAELNEKVRNGSRWIDILNFIEQLKTLDFKFTIHTVIHLNNWHGLDKLATFIKDNNYDWTINMLTYPNHLNVTNFHNKDQIVTFFEGIDIPNKESIIRHLTK